VVDSLSDPPKEPSSLSRTSMDIVAGSLLICRRPFVSSPCWPLLTRRQKR
jgi:hypothetical protein